MTEIITDLIKIIIPAALVLYGMFIVVRSFLNKEFERRMAEIKLSTAETVLTNRLSAYERMVLFLERLTPPSLLVRINPAELTAGELQHIMLHEIGNEFGHNLSQQVYMSVDAWTKITQAKEEIITLINNTAMQIPEDEKGLALAKLILDNMQNYEIDPTQKAILAIKKEVLSLL